MDHQTIKCALAKAQQLHHKSNCYSELLDLMEWRAKVSLTLFFPEEEMRTDFDAFKSVLQDAMASASFREYLMIDHRFHRRHSGVISEEAPRPEIMRWRRKQAKRAFQNALKSQHLGPRVPRPLSEVYNNEAFAPRCPRYLRKWADFGSRMSHMLSRVNSAMTQSGFSLPVQAALNRAMSVNEESQDFIDVEEFQNFHAATILAAIDDLVAALGKDEKCAQRLPVQHRLKVPTDPCNGFEALHLALPEDVPGMYSANRDLPREEEVLSKSAVFMIHTSSCHQLPIAYLRMGLRDMDLLDEIVGYTPMEWASRKRSFDQEQADAFKFNSGLLVSSTLMPLYNAMLRSGLEYGYLATTEATVFLRIDWSDPSVLYYHLAEPQVEVEQTGDMARSALGQVFLFTLMALESTVKDTDHRDTAVAISPRWDVHYREVCCALSRNRRDGEFALPTFPARFMPSPVVEEWPECHSVATPVAEPTPNNTARAYCSLKCMRTLRERAPMDPACPNYSQHVAGGISDGVAVDSVHPITLGTFRAKLMEQLGDSVTDGLVELPHLSGYGVLFQVTLLAYGYTFVGKGSPVEMSSSVKNDYDAYERMAVLQGTVIPFVLKTVDLRTLGRTYFQQHSVALVHFAFMPYPGDAITGQEAEEVEMLDRLSTAIKTVQAFGIRFEPVKRENIRIDEAGNVVLFNLKISEIQDMEERETWEVEMTEPVSMEETQRLVHVLRSSAEPLDSLGDSREP